MPPASDGTPTSPGLDFNCRATGQGTAVVDGVPYSYEVYVCGDGLTWQDDSYPEGAEETAFYLEPDGQGLELRLSAAGLQENGNLFLIDFSLSRKSGITAAAVSLVLLDDPSRSWSVSSPGLVSSAIEYEAGRFKTTDGGIGFFNTENPSSPIRVTFDVTCDTYGAPLIPLPTCCLRLWALRCPAPDRVCLSLTTRRFSSTRRHALSRRTMEALSSRGRTTATC